ncbi:MAG TPA: nuclear transport factor 2 family protein [Solirubrobacterales bacterium]|nr:nuclear transport factor 2 family protein [Solirubrobacterales bacterium]
MPTSEATETASVARAYFEAVARRDVEAMAACWEPGTRDVIHGVADMRVPEDLRAWFGNLFASLPDFSFEILDVIAAGEKAAVHWHATGTFDGTARFEGLVPNGARVDVQGCDVLTVRDGKIVHNDAYMNGAEMARQLGALPPHGSGPEKALTAALNLKTRLTARIRERRGD